MKRSTSKLALSAFITTFLASPLSAQEALPIRNCTWCHGSSAQGYANAPRLAGQTYQYLEKSLLSFKTHVRDNPDSKQYMWGAAANLDKEMAHGFALYFSDLPTQPANDGNGALANQGRAIYVEGVPESNIVSCIVCHGPKAEGFEAIPRLGGMSYNYLKRRLEQWNEGYHAAAQPMPRISNSLSSNEIEALASYLSFIK
jgi:cytochrome c553